VNVLVAVDHSDASAKVVSFVGKWLSGRPQDALNITLFHVVESLPDYIVTRSAADQSANMKEIAADWEAHNREQGEKLLADTKKKLEEAGIPAAALKTKLATREGDPQAARVLTALAIIEEMRQGPYELVVLGRRSATPAAESFIGSITEKVLREARGKTVWVID